MDANVAAATPIARAINADATRDADEDPQTERERERKVDEDGIIWGYWDEEEERALVEGVRKHGAGAWEIMRRDEQFKILRRVR
jgi:hypothetical protein